MNLEQTRATPVALWEDHADEIKIAIKNEFANGAVEDEFFSHVDSMEYDDLLKAQEDIAEFIDSWKRDAMTDALWTLKNEYDKGKEDIKLIYS